MGGFYLHLLEGFIFCFSSGTDVGLSSLLGDIGHDLVTNKFTEEEKVEGHRVVAVDGLDRVVVVVVTTVVGIKVTDT